MTVRDIYEYINGFAPFDSQAEWDNSGLLVGDFSSLVKKAVVCLDVTDKEISYAFNEGAQLIISHHPVIFRPQKDFLCGNVAYNATVKGLSIISAHTNLDKAPGGVNDTLCSVLGLSFTKCPENVSDGFLNTAELSTPLSAADAAEYIKNKLGGAVSFCDGGVPVSKVGICSGAGASFLKDALSLGCDGFITGEASYHEFLDAASLGISLFAAGHYETEVVAVRSLAEKLRQEFTDTVFVEYMPGTTVITEI